jgi:hypothetical protein
LAAVLVVFLAVLVAERLAGRWVDPFLDRLFGMMYFPFLLGDTERLI